MHISSSPRQITGWTDRLSRLNHDHNMLPMAILVVQ